MIGQKQGLRLVTRERCRALAGLPPSKVVLPLVFSPPRLSLQSD
jgi:hypothetical protein